jgi:hypothetical protein
MHNCKTTRERITELLLDGADPRLALPAELRECAECRAEFRALKETLQLTTQLIDTPMPPNSYWPGYHARLKQRLHAAQQPHAEPGQFVIDRRPSFRPSLLRRFLTTSIRVPVPVGLALVLLSALAFAFPVRVKNINSVIEVPVEVPVVQEKVVTQIVYRERKSKRSKTTPILTPNNDAVASLDGFKPAEEVKLTVIKGGAANEK